jgi:hypothetical protein
VRRSGVTIPTFKVITSNTLERFEERLQEYLDQLDLDERVVDVKFQTCPMGSGIEYTALVMTQKGSP